jgi:hypothetical protein
MSSSRCFFVDAHSVRAFAWLERVAVPICLSDWAATEFLALAHRRARAGLPDADVANAALLDFDAFAGSRARRLPQTAASGALAALLARDPALKLSARRCASPRAQRRRRPLREAARGRGSNVEVP